MMFMDSFIKIDLDIQGRESIVLVFIMCQTSAMRRGGQWSYFMGRIVAEMHLRTQKDIIMVAPEVTNFLLKEVPKVTFSPCGIEDSIWTW